MKSKLRLRWATLVAVCLALTSLVPMPAQGQNKTVSNLRYRIFDVGTFGGPTSQTNGSRILNNEGVVAGEADTAKPCPFYGGFASLISPAFRWKNGKLTNIGVLPHGCFSLPNGISRNGFIAGSSDNGIIDPNTGVPEIRADFRANGHMFNLGTFGGTNSLANDVNDHGIAVGGAENKDPDPFNFGGNLLGLPSPTAWQGFLWQGHGLKKLGTLGGPDSFALIVNQRDEISGISFTNSVVNPTTELPTTAAFFWKNGKMRNIGSFGGVFSTMSYLNDKSQVVGFSTFPGDFVGHAFVWAPDTGMKDLVTLGGTFSTAIWVNNSGIAVGGSTTLNDELFIAARWRNGAIENLGTAGGNTCSNAFQISERGEVAGQSFNCDNTGLAHATLWEPTGPAIDLNRFLPPDSNLQLAEAHFVNDRGELVVVGILPNGNPHIVVMVPCTGSESEGCRGAREDASVAQQQLAFGNNHTRLSPENLAAIKRRAIRKFRGFPGVNQN